MYAIRLLRALIVACVPAWALAPSPVPAAHAGDPYRSVDHSNDMGNDSGDSQAEGLNRGLLNENYRGPVELRTLTTGQSTAPTPPAYAPR